MHARIESVLAFCKVNNQIPADDFKMFSCLDVQATSFHSMFKLFALDEHVLNEEAFLDSISRSCDIKSMDKIRHVYLYRKSDTASNIGTGC